MSKFGTFGDYPKESLLSAKAALLTAWRSLEGGRAEMLNSVDGA